jgi:hypothetical protein
VCRVFAVFVTVVAVAAYGAASFSFSTIHRRIVLLSRDPGLAAPSTWLLPHCTWLACVAAIALVVLVAKYA